MTSSISVIIPTYNRANLIGETLRSLLNQTVPAREIIVVDDGSTDSTAEVVESEFADFSRQFSGKGNLPEFKVIKQKNAGPGAARNRGLAASTGEFIHFFDSDDIAAPNKHEVQLRALQETGADIAYGAWVKGRFAPAGARRVKSGELRVASEAAVTRYPLPVTPYARFEPVGPILQARGLPEGDLVKALLTDWSIVPHACLFRRSILERAGGFCDDMTGAEDQMMFLRCLLAGAKVVHSPGTIEFYRLGDAGKLTAQGEAQKRMARDWARYLVRAHEDVRSKEWRVKSGARQEIVGQGAKRPKDEGRREGSELAVGSWQMAEVGGRRAEVGEQMTDVRGQPKRSADRLQSNQRSDVGGGTQDEPAMRDSLPVTTTPSAWFGFRLRAYEAWKDLEKFFPGSEEELKAKLSTLGRFESGKVERWKCELAGWWVRKVAGIRGLLTGSRAKSCFRSGKYGPKEEALFCSAMQRVTR